MREYKISDLGEQITGQEAKNHLLEMMEAFDRFCDENNLTYYLSGGTLLGAIRHKGFIPWDDDVDVNMPRPDCEKLMELSNGFIGDYELLPPNYDSRTHAYHWKLYDNSVLVRKGKGKKVYPVFMDIFPIEGLPDTEEGNIKHFKKIGKWKFWAKMLYPQKRWWGATWYKKIGHFFLSGIASIYGLEKVFNKVVSIQKEIPFESSEYVGVMATNVHTTEERVKKSEYCPIIRVDFEGHKFNAPQGYDAYLRQLYGNHYMELPPVEMRVSHGLTPYLADVKDPSKVCKIAICGLVKSQNLGEMFIARSLEYLIKDELEKKGLNKEIIFSEVDILGRRDKTYRLDDHLKDLLVNYHGFRVRGIYTEMLFKAFNKMSKKSKTMFGKNFWYRLRHFIYIHGANYEKRLMKYYGSKMKDADFIVVDGAGLLEYSYNEYQEPLNVIRKYADKHGLSIVYNAIGRAGAFDERDFRSKILKAAIRTDTVKYVSARDSVETVKEVVGKGKEVKLLADAAFWLDSAQNVEPKTDRKKIGIGLIRGNSLAGYGTKFNASDWIELFSGIANLLEERGYEYEFFTNGLSGDVVLGRKILKAMHLPPEKLVATPNDYEVLYDTINGYAGIITCRMHSSIAAFTVGVPSVILSWNDKVEKLMEIVGYPERAIKFEQFDAEYIVDTFETALKEGVSEEKINHMRDMARESVTDYIDIIYNDIMERRKPENDEEDGKIEYSGDDDEIED